MKVKPIATDVSVIIMYGPLLLCIRGFQWLLNQIRRDSFCLTLQQLISYLQIVVFRALHTNHKQQR